MNEKISTSSRCDIQYNMYAEIASTFSLVISVCVMVIGLYVLYKTSIVRDNLNIRVEEIEGRFDRLISAINKANYSEYLNEVKQEEALGSVMRVTGLGTQK